MSPYLMTPVSCVFVCLTSASHLHTHTTSHCFPRLILTHWRNPVRLADILSYPYTLQRNISCYGGDTLEMFVYKTPCTLLFYSQTKTSPLLTNWSAQAEALYKSKSRISIRFQLIRSSTFHESCLILVATPQDRMVEKV